MNVLLLSKYGHLGASSRLRSYQFLPFLESRGINITVSPLLGDDYVARLYWSKTSVTVIISAYLKRITSLLLARRFDLIWFEKELLPWLPAWFELNFLPHRIPLVVDYDDAIFHNYDQNRLGIVRAFLGQKIDRIMKRADIVIVGNDYLSERAFSAGARRVEYLPTVIDMERYEVIPAVIQKPVTVGWIGTPWSLRYLSLIEPVMTQISSAGLARFVVVGANEKQIGNLPVEVRPWSEGTEVSEIQQFDIGIMPLPDEPFERGKCGYKLIQYMACGVPVVASPVGVNLTLVRDGVDGFHAAELANWHEALHRLCVDASLRHRMGASGRARVEVEYSLDVAAPRLEAMLRSVVA